MELPARQNDIAALIDKAHEEKKEKPRAHLGVSILGNKCDRAIWLKFRWASVEKFSGRMLRLFRRGHREEETIVDDLESIGCKLSSVGRNQRRVDFGCHVSGSMDGIIESGLPGAEKTKHVFEAKTHNLKSFDALVKSGVEVAKPEHYIQMQVYMLGADLNRALYYAVCKDDDRIYTERVKLDLVVATKAVERAKRLALEDRMPPPMAGSSATWFECKFCPSHALCHVSKKTDKVNCRTCARSTARPDGTWLCEKWNAAIPLDNQYIGCPSHVIHPDLVPWALVEAESTKDVAAYRIDGKVWLNGPEHNSSAALLAGAQLAAGIFGAEVVNDQA